MTRIYTRTGDQGDTSLYGAERVRKDDTRIAAFGTVDELNAVLGVAIMELGRTDPLPAEMLDLLTGIQNQLFDLGAELATRDPSSRGTDLVGPGQIAQLEGAIDRFEADLSPLKTFILPGGSSAAAWLHVARAVCRRAERWIVTLGAAEAIRPDVLGYVNRLGDLLFVLARAANQAAGQPDVAWKKGTSSSEKA
jgi:cob(I)alamin adenosyltransferase